MHLAIDLRIADDPARERTGLGRHAIEIARALPEARPAWRFSLFSNRSDLVRPAANVAVLPTRWPTRGALGRIAWLHLGSLPARLRIRPDVWFGPTFALPLGWSRPSAVMVHDLAFMLLPERYRGRLNALHASWATRSSVARATRVVCPSTETYEALRRRLDVPAHKLRLIPNGVSDIFFRTASEPSERPADGTPYLLFVGTFEARKGLETLQAAVSELNRREPRVRLVLAGRPGWGVGDLLEQMRRQPGVEVVLSPGDEELARLYRGALALTYPSHMEGFGLPVAEALAGGTPVIASDLHCIREFAGDAPLYIRSGDAESLKRHVEDLLARPDYAARIADRGRDVVAGLRWAHVAERTAEVIEEAAAYGGRGELRGR